MVWFLIKDNNIKVIFVCVECLIRFCRLGWFLSRCNASRLRLSLWDPCLDSTLCLESNQMSRCEIIYVDTAHKWWIRRQPDEIHGLHNNQVWSNGCVTYYGLKSYLPEFAILLIWERCNSVVFVHGFRSLTSDIFIYTLTLWNCHNAS